MSNEPTTASAPFIVLGCCGVNRIHAKGAGSLRPDGRRFPDGEYEYHTLYIAAGQCRVIEADGTEALATEGDLVLYRPREYQNYFHDAGHGSVSLQVHFGGDGVAAILDALGFPHKRILRIGKCREYEEVFQAMHLEYTLRKPGYEHACAALLWQTLTVIHRRLLLAEHNVVSVAGAEIYRILDTLPGRLCQDLSAKVLADECNYSVGYFSHVFRSVTGCAPAAYVNRLRLKRAEELLTMGDTPIAEIAREIGLGDPAYFSRFFRKHTGRSPSEYRKPRTP